MRHVKSGHRELDSDVCRDRPGDIRSHVTVVSRVFGANPPAPSKGPATAQFTLAGDAGLTGPLTVQTIMCGEPSLDGMEIIVFGQAGATGPAVQIFLVAGRANVRVDTGAGLQFRMRTFGVPV